MSILAPIAGKIKTELETIGVLKAVYHYQKSGPSAGYPYAVIRPVSGGDDHFEMGSGRNVFDARFKILVIYNLGDENEAHNMAATQTELETTGDLVLDKLSKMVFGDVGGHDQLIESYDFGYSDGPASELQTLEVDYGVKIVHDTV